ncbi:MAG: hypothetical protein P1U86_17975 [Verrucomicrobiales bacterium]|nr:hypothetical protein [Verrucomicrobiales bacterium]
MDISDSSQVRSSSKAALVSILSGATLLAFAAMTPVILALPGLNPENWTIRVGAFVLSLWFFVTVGLALIVSPMVPGGSSRVKAIALCVGMGIGVCFYPGIYQLMVGPSELTGSIEEVVLSRGSDGFRVNPESRTVTKHSSRKFDKIRFETDSAEKVTISLLRSHADRVIAAAEGEVAVEVLYLRYLRRLLDVRPANP